MPAKITGYLLLLTALLAGKTNCFAYSHPVPTINAGYTHYFINTIETRYNGRTVGGHAQSNGFAIGYTSVTSTHFITWSFAYCTAMDSVAAYTNSGDLKLGLQQYQVMDAGFHFGFSLRQSFSEFLAIQLGGGLYFTKINREIKVNGAQDRHQSQPGATTELLANFIYEFSKVYVYATGLYAFTINERDLITHRTGFRAGILIPLRNKNEE